MEKEKCCGCRACEQICPEKCIKMKYDEKGFMYPEIDNSKCIKCGLCKRVCPIINSEAVKQKNQIEVYKLRSKDKETINISSSGGAFVEIVKQILDNNMEKRYKIYGATIDEQNKVKHVSINDIKDINRLQKSKYVQSDIQCSYKEIKEDLKENIMVIFSGTPCQVAGLKRYLVGQDIQNLFTIDIICHGVPSQSIFDMYLQYIENKYNSKIKKINFRERRKIGNKIDSYGIKIELKNSKVIKEYSFQNLYMLGFFKDLYYRDCCGKCPFSSMERVSEITIGDFWGIKKINKKLNADTGISLCIANNEKGKEILNKMKVAEKVDGKSIKIAIDNNKNLSHPSKISPDREKFFKELNRSKDFEKTIKKYTRKKSKIEYLFRSNINDELKNKMKQILKNNK